MPEPLSPAASSCHRLAVSPFRRLTPTIHQPSTINHERYISGTPPPPRSQSTGPASKTAARARRGSWSLLKTHSGLFASGMRRPHRIWRTHLRSALNQSRTGSLGIRVNSDHMARPTSHHLVKGLDLSPEIVYKHHLIFLNTMSRHGLARNIEKRDEAPPDGCNAPHLSRGDGV